MKLETIFRRLTNEVLRYESSSFSASGCGLTRERAEAIVVKLIQRNVIPGENIDGYDIAEAWDATR